MSKGRDGVGVRSCIRFGSLATEDQHVTGCGSREPAIGRVSFADSA